MNPFLVLGALLVGFILIALLHYIALVHIRSHLREMFRDVLPLVHASGADYWVDYGTLLGIVREGDVIFGDYDIDLCVWDTPENIASLENVLRPAIERWSKYRLERQWWDAYRVCHRSRLPWIHMDIYLLTDHGTGTVSLRVGNANEGDTIPTSLLTDLTETTALGVTVRIPRDYREALRVRYGNSWMTPSMKCRLFFCTPNIKLG